MNTARLNESQMKHFKKINKSVWNLDLRLTWVNNTISSLRLSKQVDKIHIRVFYHRYVNLVALFEK